MVLIQTDYTAWRAGAISKYVCCEHCGAEYAYTMMRHAHGHGTSYYFLDEAGAEERAKRRADTKVGSALANEVEPVECPKCGRFQTDMVREARRRRWSWLRPFWAVAALVVLVPMFFCGGIYINFIFTALPVVRPIQILYATIALAALIAVLPLVRFLFSLRYDPNRDTAEQRQARGYGVGIPRADYDRILAEAAKKAQSSPAPTEGTPPETGIMEMDSRPPN